VGIMLHEMVTGLPFLEGVNSVAPSESKVKPDGRLETIYRVFGFKHVMIFSRDVKNNKMVARFGFGENIAAILPGFHFSLNF
jgi:hypothetical protein